MENRLLVLFCPPCEQYKEQPVDMSPCMKEECPHCGQLMWMSENKKIAFIANIWSGKEGLLCCYDCFKKIAEEKTKSGEWELSNMTKINI
jgi:hypothetical protein